MAWDSTATAQMVGMYSGMAMQQAQYASHIGSMASPMGDRAMGGMMNAAGAVGGPLMSAGMGLMGLDPMSMGLKAGMAAYGAGGGIMGGAAAAMGVAAPMAAGMAAVGYAGNQMYTGAQQQQQLNSNLQGGFSFRNQTTGGQGFGRGDMSQIGSQLRVMTEQFGPGGEVTSFRELSSLAGKMGSMGLAQGVRDVQDFSKRFKEMTTALKTMAKDLGTTLEGAMEFAGAARGSGVFGMGAAAKFANVARNTALSGGLAISEVTGAANIGSQISRSMGGLGRQGANAGMKAIGQIGTAQQMGILSEEDIYNVTGMTGAEGRQAYAASSMQKSAGFLQSGRGRRMLASIAGKDGSLDEGAVNELMTGGMGIGETMGRDKANLSKIGRANFIRNEGRLRGAALEKLGPFIPAMQLMQWAQSKGIDINNMDDRSMLFAQRQLGMGRDEVDQAVKMATNMPQVLEKQRRDEADSGYFQQVAQQQKGRGVEGVKQRLTQAQELINGKLQKVGQDIFNAGSDQIDRFFNKLMGAYVQSYSQDIDNASRSMRSGGALGRAAASQTFGIGGNNTMSSFRVGGGASIGGAGEGMNMGRGASGNLEESFGSDMRGGFLKGGLLGSQTAKYLLMGESGSSAMRRAGFAGVTSGQLKGKLQEIETVRRVAAQSYDESMISTGAANSEWIRRAYSSGALSGDDSKGDLRMQQFGDLLKANSPELAAKWEAAGTQAEKAAIMANLERGAKIPREAQLSGRYGTPESVFMGKGGFHTETEENEAYAAALGSKGRGSAARGSAAGAALLGGMTGGLGTGIGALLGGIAGKLYDSKSDANVQAIGAYAKSDKFRDTALGLMSGDAAVRAATRQSLQDQIMKDGEKGDLTGINKSLLAAQALAEAEMKDPNLSQKDKEQIAAANGVSVSQMEGAKAGAGQIVDKQQQVARAEMIRRVQSRANKDFAAIGIYNADGSLTKAGAESITKLGAGAKAYISLSGRMLSAEVSGDIDALNAQGGLYDQSGAALANMSKAELRQAAGGLAGTESGAEAGRALGMRNRVEGGNRRGGLAKTMSSILGAGMSAADLKGFDPTTEAGAAMLAHRAGLDTGKNSQELIAQIQKAGLAGKAGDTKGESEILRKIVEGKDYTEAQKKKSMDQAEANDPISAAISKNTEKANQLLEKIAMHSGVTATELADLNKPKDSEAAQPGAPAKT